MLLLATVAVLITACKARRFSSPFGEQLDPITRISHYSESLVGLNNSLVYGIRPVDGLIVTLWKKDVDKLEDSKELEAKLNQDLGDKRFLYCQNVIFYKNGLIMMAIIFETKHQDGTKVEAELKVLSRFHSLMHPGGNITTAYNVYKSHLTRSLHAWQGPSGYHHVLSYHTQSVTFIEQGEFSVNCQSSKKKYMVAYTNYFDKVNVAPLTPANEDFTDRGFKTDMISWCFKRDGGNYSWILRAQGADPDYKYKAIVESKHRYIIDTLYLRRKSLLDQLEHYYAGNDKFMGGMEISEDTQNARLVVVRGGYVCWMEHTNRRNVTFGYIIDMLRYTHSSYRSAGRIKKVFAVSSDGENVFVVVDTGNDVFFKAYSWKQEVAGVNFDCQGLEFGSDSTDDDVPKMSKLDISTRVEWVNYTPMNDTVSIYTKDHVYLIKDATKEKIVISNAARYGGNALMITDSFLYTSENYGGRSEVPWQVRLKKTVTPAKDGKSFVYEADGKKYITNVTVNSFLYFPIEYIDDKMEKERRFKGKFVFYGIKGCTIFVVRKPEEVATLEHNPKGCDVRKEVKLELMGKHLIVIQRGTNAHSVNALLLRLRMSLEKWKEPLMFHLTDTMLEWSTDMNKGPFSTIFALNGRLHVLNADEYKRSVEDSCRVPYIAMTVLGDKDLTPKLFTGDPIDKVLGIERGSAGETCKRYTLVSTLFHQKCRGFYVLRDSDNKIKTGASVKMCTKHRERWIDDDRIMNQQGMAVEEEILVYKEDGDIKFFDHDTKISTSFNSADLRFIAPSVEALERQLGTRASEGYVVVNKAREQKAEVRFQQTEPPVVISYEELEHVRVAEATRGCPSLWDSPYFVALVVKLLLVDFILTLLLLLIVIFHRMYIVPARRRAIIKRGITQMKRKRNMRDRLKHRLSKLVFMGEDSSEDDFVTAAGGKGMTTTNGDDFVTANAGRGATTTGAGGTTTGGNDFVTANAGQGGATTTGGDDFVTANAGKGGATTTGGDDFVTANVGKRRTTTTGGDDFVTAAGGKGFTTTTGAGAGKGTTTGDGFVTAAAGKGRTTIKHA